jgi:hypothetical protein
MDNLIFLTYVRNDSLFYYDIVSRGDNRNPYSSSIGYGNPKMILIIQIILKNSIKQDQGQCRIDNADDRRYISE